MILMIEFILCLSFPFCEVVKINTNQLVQINILISTNASRTQKHQGWRNQLRRVINTSFRDY